MLNIGCGACRHSAWTNLDLAPAFPDVIPLDAAKGLPFEANTVDVCYSSHVLEHLRPRDGEGFIADQFRVLKPRGIIRVVVPDLEQICRLYVSYLDALLIGDQSVEFKYDYTILELFDQTTREFSGGELRKAWEQLPQQHREYVARRSGMEAEPFINGGSNLASRTRKLTATKALRRARAAAARACVHLFLGESGVRAFREGLFRNSGEVHRVMYDRFRLARLLASQGFTEVAACAADQSRIPDFASFELDVVGGRIRKPDSLFMEAIKPA
jgi:predicted SAM-dependent methyltransferase